ncbi:hypothetical protein DVJ78_07175 [Humibacter sp. BT305]|nr:hypothetical protein DVJ78_07175 [Humibacter sp. BT305]
MTGPYSPVGIDTDALFPPEVEQRLVETFASSAQARPGNRTVFLGDSITRGIGDEPGPVGTLLTYRSQTFGNFASMLSGERINYVRNAGVPGNTSAQMLARFDADVAAYQPNCVVLLAGTNDANQAVDIAVTIANIKAIVGKIREIGAVPVLCTLPPTEETNPTSAERKRRIAAINLWLQGYARSEGLTLVDFFAALVDEATGGYIPAYKLDTTHPNAAGCLVMGTLLNNTLAPLLPATASPLPVTGVNPANLVTGPLMLADANSDGVADGWTKLGPVGSATVEADASIPGSWQALEAAATSDVASIFQPVSSFIAGHTYRLAARFQLVSYGSGSGASFFVRCVNASSVGTGDLYLFRNMTQPVAGVEFFDFTAPVGSTSAQVFLQVAAGTAKARIAQVALYDLTALGAE